MFVSKAHEATATLAALNCSHAVTILRPNGKPFKIIAFATDITARIGRDAGRDGDGGAFRLAPEALMLDRAGTFDASGQKREAAVWRPGDPRISLVGSSPSFAGPARPVADAPGEAHTGDAMPAAAEPASRIGNVVDMINRIAAENNLAALRATIEAARASEAMTTDLRPRSQARRPGRMA